MITSNHVALVMNLIRMNNDRRKKLGWKYKSLPQLSNIESKIIRFTNKVNKFENSIVNSKFSNWLKELFADYPLYMYSDQEDVYVYNISDGVMNDGRPYTDVSVTSMLKYAKDFRKVNYFMKKKLLEKANKVLAGNEKAFSVRYKSVLIVETQMGSGETSIAP